MAEESLDEFTPDPDNARHHPDRNKEVIEASLRDLGAGRSIVVDAENVVRCGNGTIEAAKSLGLKPRVIETDGSELVVVKRTDLDGDRAKALSLADNRASDMSEFDPAKLETLCAELQEGTDLESIGFSDGELDGLLSSMRLPEDADGVEYDESCADSVEMTKCPGCGHEFPK